MKRTAFIFLLAFLFTFSLHTMATESDLSDEILGHCESRIHAFGERTAKNAEMPLGDLTADAVANAVDCDIAIINGGVFFDDLLGGNITRRSICDVIPEDLALVSVAISPATLKAILETGVSHVTINAEDRIDYTNVAYNGFPQISGFQFTYDASAPSGNRVLSITLDENELDLTVDVPYITLATTEELAAGGCDYPVLSGATATGQSLQDALAAYIQSLGTVKPPQDNGRITVLGAGEWAIYKFIDKGPLLFALLIIAVCSMTMGGKGKKYYHFER